MTPNPASRHARATAAPTLIDGGTRPWIFLTSSPFMKVGRTRPRDRDAQRIHVLVHVKPDDRSPVHRRRDDRVRLRLRVVNEIAVHHEPQRVACAGLPVLRVVLRHSSIARSRPSGFISGMKSATTFRRLAAVSGRTSDASSSAAWTSPSTCAASFPHDAPASITGSLVSRSASVTSAISNDRLLNRSPVNLCAASRLALAASCSASKGGSVMTTSGMSRPSLIVRWRGASRVDWPRAAATLPSCGDGRAVRRRAAASGVGRRGSGLRPAVRVAEHRQRGTPPTRRRQGSALP